MSTISVPLSGDAERMLAELVSSGYGATKADVARKAIMRAAEEEAVRAVLQASEEPTLRGDLRTLAKKLA